MNSRWKLAAELFAASFLELCPDVVFKEIRVGFLGFYVDYSLPFPLTPHFLSLIEMRMREKIRDQTPSAIFEMSTKNVVERLKELKQFKLARSVDRNVTTQDVLKIGEYIALLTEEIDPDLGQVGVVHLEIQGSTIFGFSFETKEELKIYKNNLKNREKLDHVFIGKEEGLFEIVGEEVYWLPKGTLFRKRIENKVVDFLNSKGFLEVEFTGDIGWYEQYRDLKIFTTLEEEIDSMHECGLKDSLVQKIFYIPNSSLQIFKDFDKIVSLLFEYQEKEKSLRCRDFYNIFWDMIWEYEGGVKISVERIAAMLVEKRDFLVC